ncbi:NCOA4-like protein [Mya arenaria]|uniref:NCOA4-like protein n=1 Tax=Mya arenaria TaxID=6604 RepID=A0ABY7DR50_MYAAR|nr:NCOA4-like protein [Mya arenaria]
MSVKSDRAEKTMSERISALEQALRRIGDAKRQLSRNTAEAKSHIQCNISRQLEALRNREVWLLNQLDVVSSAKEEVLQQQSVRLHKTLGVLQSSARFPNSAPEETPHVSFRGDPVNLREAIMNYGKIDHTSVPALHSPFLPSNQRAPSLPKHFEDYDDAEHHVLYKTVEEINRGKMDNPCVYVNIPKLSTRVEDWLMYPLTSASTSMPESRFSFPKLSDNLADWLKAPIRVSASQSAPVGVLPQTGGSRSRGAPRVEGMSTDASIKTWLTNIKQTPHEEDEEDYDFVEEMSDTRTVCSVEGLASLAHSGGGDGTWLSAPKLLPPTNLTLSTKSKIQSEPNEIWLLKPTQCLQTCQIQSSVDMSRYLGNIREELDQWLVTSSHHINQASKTKEDSANQRLCPEVPSSPTQRSKPVEDKGTVSKWLKTSIPSRSSSASLVSSASSSSFTGLSTPGLSHWLLHGGSNDTPSQDCPPCAFMEKYKAGTQNMDWIKTDKISKNASIKANNPFEKFTSSRFEPSEWLKPFSTKSFVPDNGPSPLDNFISCQKASPMSAWLLRPGVGEPQPPRCFDRVIEQEGAIWLFPTSDTCPLENDLLEEDLC